MITGIIFLDMSQITGVIRYSVQIKTQQLGKSIKHLDLSKEHNYIQSPQEKTIGHKKASFVGNLRLTRARYTTAMRTKLGLNQITCLKPHQSGGTNV